MTQNRALMPDYLRLIALFGIVVVNVQFFAFSIDAATGASPADTSFDKTVKFLVEGLATLKSYGLFSFMFGVGLGFLMQSAERRGLAFGSLYKRRMIGLLILGLLHGTLLFYGDILVIYAVMGSLLYLMRNWAVRKLVIMGGALLLMSAAVASTVLLGDEGIPQVFLDLETSVMRDGAFTEVLFFRSMAFGIVFVLGLFFQGIAALGWFCLGLAAVKSGIIDAADHPVWAMARKYALLPGLGLSLWAAWMIVWGDLAVGQFVQAASSPIASLGYLGVIAAISRPPGPLVQKGLRAGGSSLSIYLGQSIVLSLVFVPYGLGLWSMLSYGAAVALAICITLALILGLTLWCSVFRLGPFEWVLRRFTYGGANS